MSWCRLYNKISGIEGKIPGVSRKALIMHLKVMSRTKPAG
ncbi:hypothetical protein Cst_c19210 [Thermoclostridium stercorarium subsp. stercorarium DSM 8532]|uniref:Uncharacterized protein n=1 Tax=Thermoclostridium stercorarium (strain ATCC 35414 / DSM 8532 / NCIMB 11754) TaxID=1121335 RepID=L7VTJ3_THES1|nr:hypothetical protein Cst_c19210 [Thermoclostridium stercorarium subsp. stercorarium DSM 8532]